MYSKAELEAKAHIELINIAKELGIARATRLDAQDLIYKIIGLQSENPKAITRCRPYPTSPMWCRLRDDCLDATKWKVES